MDLQPRWLYRGQRLPILLGHGARN